MPEPSLLETLRQEHVCEAESSVSVNGEDAYACEGCGDWWPCPVARLVARSILLEQELMQAQHTVEFMHGCLTSPGYQYAYPEHTTKRLAEWRALVEPDEGCPDSRYVEDCPACAVSRHRRADRAWAEEILGAALAAYREGTE